VKVIALVSSAGGMAATQEVLSGLPSGLPAAVIVLQHMSPGRASMLPEILRGSANGPVQEAVDGEELRVGRIYVTPSGQHTLVTPDRRFSLVESGAFPPSRPSGDLLLTTLALAVEADAIAVVMTGGGNDGATGASVVHKLGGLVLATDLATSSNFSMPAATIGRDHITEAVIPLPELAARLADLVLAQTLGDPS
jgi:two-component system chemotaxis response regulator CheB